MRNVETYDYPIYNCTGIYGIYIEDELVYIGKTAQSFKGRFSSHKHLVEHPEKSETQKDMYCGLAEAKKKGLSVKMVPLFIAEVTPYVSKFKLTERDLESMEFALIHTYRPRYNIKGIIQPYRYSK